ncbi:MAG: Tol-Pal system protein TolB, partial [Nevskiaceae bacterium]
MIERFARAVRYALATVLLLIMSSMARAQLQVDITSGVSAPVPMVISPFIDDAQPSAQVVGQDLSRSGRFVLQDRTRADYIVTGRAVPAGDGRVTLEFEVVNLLTGQRLLAESVTAAPTAWRNAAHRIADRIYQRILGVRSAFATRVAYVAVDGVAPTLRYRLIVADADGESPRTILQSRLPIMSPAWSRDAESIAYVSCETRSAAIYVQTVRTAERRRVSARAGVNGAPAWSPDGKRLALTLSSSSGNLDVYTLELESGALTRVTEHPAIDTEPVWSSDGSAVYFTSDRAGGPQIYRAAPAASAAVQRVSFSGSYNARPRV